MIKNEIFIIINIIAYSITYLSYWDLVLEIKSVLIAKIYNKIILDLFFLLSSIYFTYQFTFKLSNGYIPILFFVFLILGFFCYFYFIRHNYLILINTILIILSKYKVQFINLIKELLYNKAFIRFIKNELVRVIQSFKGNKNKK